MITEPEKYIEVFAEAGSDLIALHEESTPHLHRAVQMVRGCGQAVGVTINPATPLHVLDEILEYVDLVLLMTGQSGIRQPEIHPHHAR